MRFGKKDCVEDCSIIYAWEFLGNKRKCNISEWLKNDYLKKGQLEIQAGSMPYPQKIPLTTTKCNYGGERVWFLCPHCYERKGALYRLPWTEQGYYCSMCLKLTYKERQEKGSYLFDWIRAQKRKKKALATLWRKGIHAQTFLKAAEDLSYYREMEELYLECFKQRMENKFS